MVNDLSDHDYSGNIKLMNEYRMMNSDSSRKLREPYYTAGNQPKLQEPYMMNQDQSSQQRKLREPYYVDGGKPSSSDKPSQSIFTFSTGSSGVVDPLTSLCPPAPTIDNAQIATSSIWPGANAKEGDFVDVSFYLC